jgi:hypothetical protein
MTSRHREDLRTGLGAVQHQRFLHSLTSDELGTHLANHQTDLLLQSAPVDPERQQPLSTLSLSEGGEGYLSGGVYTIERAKCCTFH